MCGIVTTYQSLGNSLPNIDVSYSFQQRSRRAEEKGHNDTGGTRALPAEYRRR